MVTWEYYQEQFPGGCIPEERFEAALVRAIIQHRHFCHWYHAEPLFPDSESKALCAMAEALFAKEPEVVQKTVGEVSVRYENRKTLRRIAYEAMLPYYKIYRGVSNAVPW